MFTKSGPKRCVFTVEKSSEGAGTGLGFAVLAPLSRTTAFRSPLWTHTLFTRDTHTKIGPKSLRHRRKTSTRRAQAGVSGLFMHSLFRELSMICAPTKPVTQLALETCCGHGCDQCKQVCTVEFPYVTIRFSRPGWRISALFHFQL